MQKLGYMREGVFQSVDLFFPNGLVINAPCKTEFSELSPYYIEYSGSSYVLMYNDELLTEISFDVVDTYSQRVATNGTLYRQAAFWQQIVFEYIINFDVYLKNKTKDANFAI